MDSNFFDENYYEFGVETGKSTYSQYRWLPEKTIPMVMSMIDYLNIKNYHTVLDVGCAKGYVVKAFRWLKRSSYGVDISDYALENCDPEVKDWCFHLSELKTISENISFDWAIAKDVFEHISYNDIEDFLFKIPGDCMFAVIPLGNGEKYYAPVNNLDRSHIICKDMSWWVSMFEASNWKVEESKYHINGIKDAYYTRYPNAHGFFTLKRIDN